MLPVLILTGAPGSGKTSVARILAAGEPRAVHLEADRFFRFIASGYVEPWRPESHEQNTAVMRIVAAAAAGYAEAGYFTVVDGIVIPRWFLDPLRDSLRAAGRTVAYAVLRAPLATCLDRAGARDPDTLSDPAVIEQLWREFEDLRAYEAHAIDADGRAPEEVAAELRRRLDAGELAV